MKVPYSWLAEWVELPADARELASRLTMSGFEVESLEPAAPPFSGVLVAEIIAAERHPQADKLQVCQVSIGRGEPLQIVCGASNARAGLKSALATVGARLPGDVTIGAAKLRGIESQGMLASARELGLAESSSGILELPEFQHVDIHEPIFWKIVMQFADDGRLFVASCDLLPGDTSLSKAAIIDEVFIALNVTAIVARVNRVLDGRLVARHGQRSR